MRRRVRRAQRDGSHWQPPLGFFPDLGHRGGGNRGPPPVKRKLTTILFADAQGYTALMASDEAATLERLNRYRAIMGGLFERHEGRQVNTWGDAVIAEFSSVVEAVRCAVEIQDSLSDRERRPAASRGRCGSASASISAT